jgi:hypothetical protein
MCEDWRSGVNLSLPNSGESFQPATTPDSRSATWRARICERRRGADPACASRTRECVRLWRGKTIEDVGREAESVPTAMAGKPGLAGHSERLLELKFGVGHISNTCPFRWSISVIYHISSYIMCNPRVGGFECAIYSRFVERGRGGGCHAPRTCEREIRAFCGVERKQPVQCSDP